jgi:hypothetical protein
LLSGVERLAQAKLLAMNTAAPDLRAAIALQRFLVRTFIAVAKERQAQLAEAMKAAAEQRL